VSLRTRAKASGGAGGSPRRSRQGQRCTLFNSSVKTLPCRYGNGISYLLPTAGEYRFVHSKHGSIYVYDMKIDVHICFTWKWSVGDPNVWWLADLEVPLSCCARFHARSVLPLVLSLASHYHNHICRSVGGQQLCGDCLTDDWWSYK
jgi:hypothetical protein